MRKTFVVGKLSRAAAQIVVVHPGPRASSARALRALVGKARTIRA